MIFVERDWSAKEYGRLAEWLMQRIANPSISVQFRYRPPKYSDLAQR